MIVDTDILIEALRGNRGIIDFLLTAKEELVVNRVTVMELINGTRAPEEISIIDKLIKSLDINIKEITEENSVMAGNIHKKYHHAYGIGIIDAIIAATALIHKQGLSTGNTRHFRFIPGLKSINP